MWWQRKQRWLVEKNIYMIQIKINIFLFLYNNTSIYSMLIILNICCVQSIETFFNYWNWNGWKNNNHYRYCQLLLTKNYTFVKNNKHSCIKFIFSLKYFLNNWSYNNNILWNALYWDWYCYCIVSFRNDYSHTLDALTAWRWIFNI